MSSGRPIPPSWSYVSSTSLSSIGMEHLRASGTSVWQSRIPDMQTKPSSMHGRQAMSVETTLRGAPRLKSLSTASGATLGSPSWPIGPQGLLRFLSHTMPDFPMMRCTFLRLILTFCSWARQPTICRDPFLKPCEAKAASTCPFAAGSAFSRSRCAATQSQRPRLEASRAPQAALTLKDGSSSLSRKISPNLSGFSAARGARWALLASVPRAFKAFACAFRDSLSARCEAMAFSSRLLARSFCLASPSSISASSRAPMALCLSTASRFSRRMLSTLSRCLACGASVFVRAPSISASFQRQAARSMRLQPMREAGSPAWAKIPPGLSPSWQSLMHPSLNRSEQTGDPVLTSSTASSGMRQARSSFVNLPSIIYEAPFHPWPAAGRNRAVLRFRIGCAEYGVQVTKLGEAYRIYAPVLKKGEGRFTDVDVVRYDFVASGSEMEFEKKSDYPAKEILSPLSEKLFYCTEDSVKEADIDPRDVIVFLRACDLHGVRRLDQIYLGNGPSKDYFYKRIRDHVHFALIGCTKSFASCFCVDMGTNVAPVGWMFSVEEAGDKILSAVTDKDLDPIFAACAEKEEDVTPASVTENEVHVTRPETVPNAIYRSDMRNEYTDRCIECGRCTIACPGKRLCPFGCYDTTAFAQRMDQAIFPNNRHVKVAFTGCPNDCAHVALNDFGIIGMTEPQHDPARCIGCGQCVKWCQRRSVSALEMVNGKAVRNEDRCIGCGVCVVYCPTRAWTRSPEHCFRLKIMGRTGKQNPRMAEDWLRWVDEESILKIVKNTCAYIEEYINPNAPEGKEHIGYIVDRTGFDEFVKWALKDVELPEKCQQAHRVCWGGTHYDRDNELK